MRLERILLIIRRMTKDIQASGVHLVHSRHLLLMICVLEDGQGQQRLSADYMSKGA